MPQSNLDLTQPLDNLIGLIGPELTQKHRKTVKTMSRRRYRNNLQRKPVWFDPCVVKVVKAIQDHTGLPFSEIIRRLSYSVFCGNLKKELLGKNDYPRKLTPLVKQENLFPDKERG